MKIIILTIVILGLMLVFFGNTFLTSINDAEIIKNFSNKQADGIEAKRTTSTTSTSGNNSGVNSAADRFLDR